MEGDNFQTLMQQINEQSLHPEEVIVIDSSSSDSTRAYAQEAGATVITIVKNLCYLYTVISIN